VGSILTAPTRDSSPGGAAKVGVIHKDHPLIVALPEGGGSSD
jgi:hypothetical protein